MKKAISLVLSFAMLISVMLTGFSARAENYVATENVRPMLSSINSFRTDGSPWYWNESNSKKVYEKNLGKLKYDENLEKIAKKRAKEIIGANFGHTRPNGKQWFTCTATDADGDTVKTYGENIAAGTGLTMEMAFQLWREDDKDYLGQGHRRNMLYRDFTCIGIAAYEAGDGWVYWVQEFGYHLSPQESGEAEGDEGGEEPGGSSSASKPAATKLLKLTPKAKSFTAKWGVKTEIDGYQLQYAADKKFKKSKKTVTVKGRKKSKKTVKKLKSKRKYFVRVRTYKLVNGKKVYSKWSKAKAVKTK